MPDKKIVHLRPVREVFDNRLGQSVIRGRDVENHERMLARMRAGGYKVTEVPDDGQEHFYWTQGPGAKPCRTCNADEKEKRTMTVAITMDADDFDRLCTTSMQWAGHKWESYGNRFENTTAGGEPQTSQDWSGWQLKMAYWVGDSWISVMLVRAYLSGLGSSCGMEILWDPGSDDTPGEFVVLTDYETESWKNRRPGDQATGNSEVLKSS